ncbi:MAG: flavin monoamine oxidase family protein [Acidiphilium sp.]
MSAPITMFGPDFPFAYDDFLAHPAGLGRVPEAAHGTEIAIVGAGIAGIVAAHELMKLGLKPVIYESDRIGGRLRSEPFKDGAGAFAELGAMRFPPASRALFHYIDKVGLETREFPNPLAPGTASTVIELAGQKHYAARKVDLPPLFHEVERAWSEALEEGADFASLTAAIRARDIPALRRIWHHLVDTLDEESFYGFIAKSRAFRELGFRAREIFGQVGFGTGGWDTDFPNSILEILRVVATGADDEHRLVVGGVEQLPRRLWALSPEGMAHWPSGTSLATLHGGAPRPGVACIAPGAGGGVAITDRYGNTRNFPAVVVTCQVWLLSARIDCAESLFHHDLWMAMERTHYMQSSKTFVMVDRPFWRDAVAGQDAMSMTLTDRLTRGTYLLDNGPDRPGVICLSYTWNDDALKWLALPMDERVRLMLHSLRQIYPALDIGKHIIGAPITVSWESDPNFMGAFKANLPGHYRYQRRLFSHFVQNELPPHRRGIFLAGDDISWTAGWAEGAVTTALNAVAGIVRHFGGGSAPGNPDPIDRWDELAPIRLIE